MKRKIIKTEKLVLKKATIARLNTGQMEQLVGGIWTVKTVWDTKGGSQNSHGGSCYTCGPDMECQWSYGC